MLGRKPVRLVLEALDRERGEWIRAMDKGCLGQVAMEQNHRCAVGQTLLVRAGQGTAEAFVPMGDVKGLPIVVAYPGDLQRDEDLEEESVALSREVEDLSRRLQRLSRQGWLEVLRNK